MLYVISCPEEIKIDDDDDVHIHICYVMIFVICFDFGIKILKDLSPLLQTLPFLLYIILLYKNVS